MTASQIHVPAVKVLRHPAPEKFARFANFESFKTFTGCHEGRAEALHPFRFVGRCFLLHSGKDDAVRGARTANFMPGGEELSRDLRSHEPEPLTGVRDLSCM